MQIVSAAWAFVQPDSCVLHESICMSSPNNTSRNWRDAVPAFHGPSHGGDVADLAPQGKGAFRHIHLIRLPNLAWHNKQDVPTARLYTWLMFFPNCARFC